MNKIRVQNTKGVLIKEFTVDNYEVNCELKVLMFPTWEGSETKCLSFTNVNFYEDYILITTEED